MNGRGDGAEGVSTKPLVCVQGVGFVGAAMCVAVASARNTDGLPAFDVVGVDLPTPEGSARVAALNHGEFPFETTDTTLTEALARARKTGNLRATTEQQRWQPWRLRREVIDKVMKLLDKVMKLLDKSTSSTSGHPEGAERPKDLLKEGSCVDSSQEARRVLTCACS